jgi:chemotaxis signal transduction protein
LFEEFEETEQEMLTQVDEVTRRRSDRPTQRKAAYCASRKTISLTIFGAGAGRFGIPTDAVLYIARTPTLGPASVPSPWIRGMARLRGELVEVWDMAAWSRSPETSPGVFTVVVGNGSRKMGLLVDRVVGFREIVGSNAIEDVDGPPDFAVPCAEDAVSDVTAVIDLTRLLNRPVARGMEGSLTPDAAMSLPGQPPRAVSRSQGVSHP